MNALTWWGAGGSLASLEEIAERFRGVQAAAPEGPAPFPRECGHCGHPALLREDDGPYCLACGWRPSRAPSGEEQSQADERQRGKGVPRRNGEGAL